jgi:hypothetical protein
MKIQHLALTASAALVLALAACGGGGGGTQSSTTTPVSLGAASSGAISAFGSVFVNGHEFSTTHASVVDDDTGATSTSTTGLEVGEVVDVIPSSASTNTAPEASELHVHPLARGYVDASDSTASTLTVMGQTVQLTSATNFSDHRACVVATTSPCAAVTGQAGLGATTGSGTNAVAGSYVTVHGYLFASAPTAVNIVATLVSVSDVPTSTTTGANFKAEGVVNATGTSAITVGGLNINLASATCRVSGVTTACASAFSVGQVVSSIASAAPSLPAVSLLASNAHLGANVAVDTATSSVEVEGGVSSVNTTASSFVVRGLSVDASKLPAGSALPAVGDIVRVLGALSSNGQSVAATSVTVLHAAASASLELSGDASGVAAGSSSGSYVVSVLGESINVTSSTRLADHSTKGWWGVNPATNPFNITTFQTYLAASASQHLMVHAEADASGNLNAVSITIAPASTVSSIAGLVDSSPAPVNSTVTATPSSFSIHALKVSADPAAIFNGHGKTAATVAAGDQVLAVGSFAAGTLTITATPSKTNGVIDLGVPKQRNRGGWF